MGGPVALSPDAFTLRVGTRQQLAAVMAGKPFTLEPDRATWSSSDSTVLLVSATGEAFAVASGAATISLSLPGRPPAQAQASVVPAIAGVWLGSASDTSFILTLNEVTQENSPVGAVSGSVSIRYAGDSLSLVPVEGTRVHPEVSLFLRDDGTTIATYTGTFVDDTSIAGSFTRSSGGPRDLSLTRPWCYCPLLLAAPLDPARIAGPCACGPPPGILGTNLRP